MSRDGIDVRASIGAFVMAILTVVALMGFVAVFGDNISEWLG